VLFELAETNSGNATKKWIKCYIFDPFKSDESGPRIAQPQFRVAKPNFFFENDFRFRIG
jgi:hypothetical protein